MLRKLTTVAALLVATSFLFAACGSDEEEAAPAATTTTAATVAPAEDVVVCELAYYTGEFGSYGAFLTASLSFAIDNVINTDPPLGRTWDLVSEDIGTVGEGQAARTCLERHGAEILVSPAHGYRPYRSWLQEWLQENDSPLMPTVHGGTIPGNLGGTGSEPIFRAQGLDEALGMSSSLYADSVGAKTAVIFATQVEGFQIAATAASLAADVVGIEVLARIDVPAEQPSYRAEAERIADLAPDVVIVQAGGVESATLINETTEAGASLHWIGETGWVIPEFMAALGAEGVAAQQSVGFAAFAHNDDTPAWDFYAPLWTDTPGYGDTHGDASDMYHFSAYDLLVHTALAVEKAGSYNASDWAPAMFEVGDGPGTVCYTYTDCLALIRAGEDIDYEGVTGPGSYSPGGVNAVTQSYTPYNDDGSLGEAVLLDSDRALEIIGMIAIEAECDENNECDWGGAPAEADESAAPAEDVVVCELAYYTGEFGSYGAFLTASLSFAIDNVINTDPPLGRTWDLVSEDIGTVGEGQAARTCLERHGAEILVSPAHGYRPYRSWLQEWLQENDSPLMPTVHGGTIPGNLGGTGSEPIFRAQGLDEALGMSSSLYADSVGAKTAVIFATQVEGFQIAATAASLAADVVGIEVLARIDVPAEQPSYRAEAERIADLAPDVVIVQAGGVESATLINETTEAGASLHWIGETGWVIPEFMAALGAEGVAAQQSVGFAAFAHNDDTPAWDFYAPLWTDTPGYGDTHGDASDMYHFSAYDLLVHTALAVEKAGSYNASDWAPAMFEVGDGPGTVCYTYTDCLALIRAGEDIDYEGVTGPGSYSPGGVNAVTQSYTPYNDDGSLGEAVLLDSDRALEIIGMIAIEAECDENNECAWGG